MWPFLLSTGRCGVTHRQQRERQRELSTAFKLSREASFLEFILNTTTYIYNINLYHGYLIKRLYLQSTHFSLSSAQHHTTGLHTGVRWWWK